jgi:tetratricopeptide (TPR) repeat protein
MGTVYEAYEETMRRTVALKVISRHLAPSGRAAERFAREAWIGGRLSHPNLVKVYERGVFEDVEFYAMELADGGSLADVIATLRRDGRDRERDLAFGTREYVLWAIQQVISAARALDHAHRQGVIHRDVKPMNLLLTRDPQVLKVADFGLAVDLEATRMTTAGKTLGTPAYMAPEQILGQSDAIDVRTDVYALGVTLFELLTLELPYVGPTQQLYINAVLTAEARRPSRLNEKVGRDLEIVVRKALEKDPRDRYASAAAFADDLENVLAFRPIAARAPGTAERLWKMARRRPIHAALVLTLVVGTPVVAILGRRTLEHRRLVEALRVEAMWESVRLALQGGRYRETIARAGELLAIAPAHVPALRARAAATIYLLQGSPAPSGGSPDPQAAAESRRAALADIDRIVALEPQRSWPYRLRAFALSRFGRDDEAGVAAAAAAARRRDPPDDDDLFFAGLLAVESGDFATGTALFSELIARSPDRRDAFGERGEAYESLGETERAVNDFRVAVALAPGSFLGNYRLGRLLTASGDLEEGVPYLRRAVGLDPGNPYGHEALSDGLRRAGRAAAQRGEGEAARALLEEAVDEAQRALRVDPGLPWSNVNLGAALIALTRLRQPPDRGLVLSAIEANERALDALGSAARDEDRGARAAALSNRCDALTEIRDLERGLAACLEVTRFAPEEAVGFYNLAGVYALLGRADEALEALDRDVALGDLDHEYLAADPWFTALRRDPRFTAILRRMRAAGASARAD